VAGYSQQSVWKKGQAPRCHARKPLSAMDGACFTLEMIIACPACATRYVVPDSAIGVDGRTVRCAKCRHSWFQDGPELPPRPSAPVLAPPSAPAPAQTPAPTPEPVSEQTTQFKPQPPPAEPEPVSEQTTQFTPQPPSDGPQGIPLSEQRTVFAPQPPSQSEPLPTFAETARAPVASSAAERGFEDSPSSFAHEPPFRPRRNPARLWTAAAIAFALLVAALIGAVSIWGMPAWVPIARMNGAEAQPDLVLEFPPEQQDRRTLPNGVPYFGASGTVTNVGREKLRVPPILIVLRDARERIVYTWEVRSPKSELAPGESVTINEAVTDVPRSAKVAEIGWKPG